MGRSSFLLVTTLTAAAVLALSGPAPAATGLYTDIFQWFQPSDTTTASAVISHSELDLVGEDASLTGLHYFRRLSSKTSIEIGIYYAQLRRNDRFRHGFGDASISAVRRVYGDSLNASGLFVRLDVRAPVASGALYPFGFRSGEGGVYPAIGSGLEFRKRLSDLGITGSATYTAAAQTEKVLYPRNKDFLMLAVKAKIWEGRKTSLSFGFFNMIFTGGGYREAYTASLRQSLSGQLDLILRGAVERGESDDRVFDSVISLALSFRLPTAKPEAKRIPADEIDAPPGNRAVPGRDDQSPPGGAR